MVGVVPSVGMSEGRNKVLVLIRHEMLRRYVWVLRKTV